MVCFLYPSNSDYINILELNINSPMGIVSDRLDQVRNQINKHSTRKDKFIRYIAPCKDYFEI